MSDRRVNNMGREMFEKYSSISTIKTRDIIEATATLYGIPPSEMELVLIDMGEINELWENQ